MRRRALALSGFLIFLASIPGFLFTSDPIARDQGVFATIGWQWLLGGVPYTSAGFEHKGPLPFAAYALSQLIFGHSIGAARLLAWISLVLTAFLVAAIAYKILSRSSDRAAGAVTAGALYALITGAGGLSTWWSGAQAESFMEPFVAAALLLALTAHPMAAGAALGIATLGKPVALLLAPLLVFAGGVPRWPRARRIAIGIVIPWGVTIGYLALRGALPAFLDADFLVNFDYGRGGFLPGLTHLGALVTSGGTVIPTMLLPTAGLGIALAGARDRGKERIVGFVILTWLVLAVGEVIVQGRYYGYHFHPVVAPVALGIGAFVAHRRSIVGPDYPKWVGVALALFFFSGAIEGIWQLDWRDVGIRWDVARGAHSRGALLDSIVAANPTNDVDPRETEAAATWLMEKTPADRAVLVWGFEPGVNFLAERRSPTRFLYDWFLTSPRIDPARRERYRRIFMSEIKASPPSAVVVVHNDANAIEARDSAAQLTSFPEFAAWMAAGYDSVARVGDFEIFRERGAVVPR